MTKELITDFYNALVLALPEYNIFLNDDGKKMRNPARTNEDPEITCVEDALSSVGVALVVGSRLTNRTTKTEVIGRAVRVLKVPIEIRTQRIGSTEPTPVLDILDDLESAVVSLRDNSLITNWTLEEGGEYENRPGWGFLVVSKIYSVKRK